MSAVEVVVVLARVTQTSPLDVARNAVGGTR